MREYDFVMPNGERRAATLPTRADAEAAAARIGAVKIAPLAYVSPRAKRREP